MNVLITLLIVYVIFLLAIDGSNKCYIAGKVTGLEKVDAAYFFLSGERWCEANGLIPVNPFALFDGSQLPYWHIMFLCIRQLAGCRTVFMLNNWRDSRGARIERVVAMLMLKRIVYQK